MKTNKKGISLIVLVITIIVMIILATAVILSLDGSDIINEANKAVKKHDLANAKTVVALADAEWQLMSQSEREEEGTFSTYANSKLEEAGFKIEGNGALVVNEIGAINTKIVYIDNSGVEKSVVIPEGFVASAATGENVVADGLVIYEGTEAVTDSNVEQAQKTRNQYVWVPVTGTLNKKNWGTSTIGPADTFTKYSNYGTTAESKEFTAIKDSISKYGGYYIARYEAGLPNETTSATANYGQIENQELTIPVSVKNATVWTSIPWDSTCVNGDGNYGSWDNPGSMKVSRNAYMQSNSVSSNLIYGAQWDAALTFVSETHSVTDSSSWGNYEDYNSKVDSTKQVVGAGTLQKTGFSEYWKAKNIYDLAGNSDEQTMEVYKYSTQYVYRTIRGGNCNTTRWNGCRTF